MNVVTKGAAQLPWGAHSNWGLYMDLLNGLGVKEK
jgi:hypothetical protein